MKMHLIICTAIISALTAGNVDGEADGPDYWRVHGVASSDVLNIRQAANAASERIGLIPPDGQCVKNLGCLGGLTFQEFSTLSADERAIIEKERPRWCRVEYQGLTGWVAGRYLREGACPSGTRQSHPPGTKDIKD